MLAHSGRPPKRREAELPDGYLDSELLEALRACDSDTAQERARHLGSAALPTLLAAVRREVDFDDDTESEASGLSLAVYLLDDLKDPRAVKPLCTLLSELVQSDLPVLEDLGYDISQTLQALDEPAIEQYLALYEQLEADPRAGARDDHDWLYEALARSGRRDERIFAVLSKEMRRRPIRMNALLADYGDPRGIDLIVDAMERYSPESVKDNDLVFASTVLYNYKSSLDRLGHELSPELRAKSERAHQAVYLSERPDERSLGPAPPPARLNADQRRRKKTRKNRRKRQRASRKRNRK